MQMNINDKDGTFLISIDISDLKKPHTTYLHMHQELEISCVLDGNATYIINGKHYDMQKGDVFVLSNTDYHGISFESESENYSLQNLVIHFNPSFIWDSLSNKIDYNFLLIFFERGDNFSHRLDRNNPTTAKIYQLLLDILEEFQEDRMCYQLMVKVKLQTIFAEIIRSYDYIDWEKAVKPLPESDIQHLNDVLNYINNHLDSDIRLAQLASIAHVSPAYFSTMFKKYNGLSPIEYIVHQRVQKAALLIRTTNDSLTDIAMNCGFNNSTNFYKAFRKVTGRTPISYRKDPPIT